MRLAKEELDAIDTQRLACPGEHEQLPSQSQALVGRLTALHEGQKALIGGSDARVIWPLHRVSWLHNQNYDRNCLSAENTTDRRPRRPAELVRRRSGEGELQSLLSQYREKRPDVISEAKTALKTSSVNGSDD
jgi:hypothetical protein